MAKSSGGAYSRMPVAGEHYPADLAGLRAWFPTDDACLNYLDWLRWPGGFACPHCGGMDAGKQADGVYRCHDCRKKVSVISGTIFHKTRVPLTVWFEAVWLLTSDKGGGVTAAHLHRVLPIASYQTAWSMLGKLRSAMTTMDHLPLSGFVEVDETFIGGPREGTGGRGAEGKVLVAGAIEIKPDGWGRARMSVIPDASANSLGRFITANIAAGSTVITDGWRPYGRALRGYGYIHHPVVVSATSQPAHIALPGVHRLFALVKQMIGGTYYGAVKPEHLDEYLDEFVFRFNRRTSESRGLVFMRLLQKAVGAPPVSYAELVRVPTPKNIHPTGAPGPHTKPGTLNLPPLDYPWRQATTLGI